MRIAATPEDFAVDELPLYAPSGEGAHTFVRVEKRLRNTEEVARALARLAGVRPGDVGYAGRKDRVAVTRQWFSVPGLDPAAALAFEQEGVRVLEAVRHPHKLRTGQLAANRFELVLRELSDDELARAPSALAGVVRVGLANRFGAQRFGRDGDNAERGRALLAGAPLGPDRRAARFLVSALQAEVFNAFLARRALPIDAIEVGEVAWIHASGACFVAQDAAREAERAAAFEISASGPILGTRTLAAQGAPFEREQALLRELCIPEPLRPPPGLRLRGARRPVRIRPEDASAEPLGDGALRVRFTLPPGSYATVLVDALLAAPMPRS